MSVIEKALSEQLPSNVKIIVGDRFIPGSSFKTEEDAISQLFDSDDFFSLQNIIKLSDNITDIYPYPKLDDHNRFNYVFTLPVFVQSEVPLQSFIPLSFTNIQALTNSIKDGDLVAFGFGENPKLSSFFENDYDCMFGIAQLLGVNFLTLPDPTDNPTGALGNKLFILPFYTLISFSAVYPSDEVLDRFLDWLRIFRTTKSVFDLIGIKHKVVRGNSIWLESPITDNDAKIVESFPELKGVYEEVILTKENNNEYSNKLQISTFEEATNNVICSFVTWIKGSNATKILYPISYDDIKLLDDLKEQLKIENSVIDDNNIVLDDSNENLLLDLILNTSNNLLE
ncbi:hypothetical protein [Thalassotalea piscium]|uniref:Uncharacterized protein n=1 Tax=Thalassotalea piscium TaxID=1230533 RepID=A0A7X0TTG4_9GAMM|nr:hypothetical protein [Thalassotalea piscium]MBB6543060.1 hypothetical protein [Thalassotalea piscium]